MLNAAIGLVEDPLRKNYFLWVKRHDVPVWVLPGGGIDPGETPEEAVTREVLEESGLIVTVERNAAIYTPINNWTAETHIFICKSVGGVFTRSDESQDVAYFSVDSPPAICFPLHILWLNEALHSPQQVIKRPLTEFTWHAVGAFFLKHPYITLRYLVTLLFSQSRS
jgi:8-oxo-dGTP diphosphatase